MIVPACSVVIFEPILNVRLRGGSRCQFFRAGTRGSAAAEVVPTAASGEEAPLAFACVMAVTLPLRSCSSRNSDGWGG